jgi:UDP-N-acetylglucosamine--N-acetylmuramyl-(pentapeptide) pyrophosphoryl-undecaprenol N-acetylglucosamine transferase
VPSIIHEQNEYPGRAIKAAAKFTDTIALSFEDSKKYFSDKMQRKIVVTGNPVRKEFEAYTKEIARKTLKLNKEDKLILCLGGSLGARNINTAALEMAKKFKDHKNIKIYLITGQKQYEQMLNSIDLSVNANVKIMPYSDEMPLLLNACDLVICRGGASTLFENMITATPGIYIPYPYASADHQRKNINYITSRGGGVMIEDESLDEDTLYNEVSRIIFDDKKIEQMSKNAKAASAGNALDKFYTEIIKLTKDK